MRLLALLLAGLAPVAAAAAPTLVRTGEHDGFTRMVVDFANRPDWSLEPDGEAVVLRTGRAVDYDLSRIFRRIGRDRVADVTATGEGDLRIDLGCACDVRTIELPNEWLVIDIHDGDGGPPPPLPPLATEPRDLVVVPGLLRDIERGDPMALLRRSRLAEIRDSVEQGVDRSIAQGLTRPSDAAAGGSAEIRLDPEPDKPDLSAFGNIRIGTQIDRDRSRLDARGTDCPAPEWFAVEGWGDAGEGIGSLSALRSQLYASEDGPAPEAARDLARGLLYFTFGIEAADVLRLDPVPSGERDALLRIAAIMDGGSVGEESYPHATCGGGASLWAILGGLALPDQVLQSALGAFDRMPAHLRRHLGPRLARRLLAEGYAEEARLVERAVARNTDAPGAEAAFAAAEISQHDGRGDDARAILEDLATSGLPQAGAAMADLLASLARSDEAASNALIDHAVALSFELDGAVGARLDGEIVLALGRNQRFGEAMSYLYSRDTGEGAREELRDDIYGMVIEADDLVFLQTAARLLDGPRPGEIQSLALASRLADHGLVSQARAYLDGIEGPPRRDERLIRARLASIDGGAGSAETYLAGLGGAEVEEIRDGLNMPPQLPISPEIAEAEPPLADMPSLPERSRALLEESEALREALSGLAGR